MNMIDIILKKRNGELLTKEEIRFFVEGYTSGKIPDYQASALLMAIYFRGLTDEEVFFLTEGMRDSGVKIDLSDIKGVKIDKHSSGGVGDKVSIVAGPIVAAAGVKVAKISGRGLGFTGGTIDKLESIEGFNTNITVCKFKEIIKNVGISIMGQSEEIVKADKLIYALRDVTGTVEVKGLIASSIMSKKLALDNDGILLDVKYGQGALMKNYDDAFELAELMKKIGNYFEKKTDYILSSMEEPLGNNVGNACEIIESIETLKGNGPEDLTRLSLEVAANMIVMGGKAKNIEEGKEIGRELIENKSALHKMRQFIRAQGGNENVIDDYNILPKPKYIRELILEDQSKENRKIKKIDASVIGNISLICGAGRRFKEDIIDLSAGVTILKKSGEIVKNGDILAEVYGNDYKKVESAFKVLETSFKF